MNEDRSRRQESVSVKAAVAAAVALAQRRGERIRRETLRVVALGLGIRDPEALVGHALAIEAVETRRVTRESGLVKNGLVVSVESLFEGRRRLRLVAPAVERFRTEVWGSTEPRFSTALEAEVWAAKGAPKPTADLGPKRFADLCREVGATPAYRELKEAGYRIRIDDDDDTKTLSLPTGKDPIVVEEGTDQARAASLAAWLAEATGFTEAAMCAHLLYGFTPMLPAIEVARDGHTTFGGRHAAGTDGLMVTRFELVLRIRARDVGYDAWRELRYPIRAAFNEVMDPRSLAERPAARRTLTETDRLFLDVVVEEGGLPEPGRRSEWYKKVRNKLEKRGIVTYKDHTGVRNRLRRIRRRFPHWEALVNPQDPQAQRRRLIAVHRLPVYEEEEDHAEEA